MNDDIPISVFEILPELSFFISIEFSFSHMNKLYVSEHGMDGDMDRKGTLKF